MHTTTLSITSRVIALGLAAAVTFSIMGSLDALATTGQAADALLSQQGSLQLACTDPARKA